MDRCARMPQKTCRNLLKNYWRAAVTYKLTVNTGAAVARPPPGGTPEPQCQWPECELLAPTPRTTLTRFLTNYWRTAVEFQTPFLKEVATTFVKENAFISATRSFTKSARKFAKTGRDAPQQVSSLLRRIRLKQRAPKCFRTH